MSVLPPAPSGRSATVAASTPAAVPPGVLQGAATCVVLATWGWFAGAHTWALVAAIGAMMLLSLWAFLYEDLTWVGDDWIAARGLCPTFVIDVDDIESVDVPVTDIGPTQLVVAHRARGIIRVELGDVYGHASFGAAVAALLQRAVQGGATISPSGCWLLDDIRRRAS